ncbi:MAG: substrate-binding domain-containing protein, partial [Bifidobacteriaceae bacterium]|nr:substrate-binding domain-containing protein [Bifidobacteriaceae bacterium]
MTKQGHFSRKHRFPKALAAMLLSVVTLATAGCGQQSATTASDKPAAPSSVTIGFVGAGSTQGPRVQQMEQQTVDGLRSRGIKVEYVAARTALDQTKAIDHFVNDKASVIVLSPESLPSLGDALQAARAQGRNVVLLDRMPSSATLGDYDSYIGPNYQALGNQAGQWALEHGATKGSLENGDFIVVRSALDSVAGIHATYGWLIATGTNPNTDTDSNAPTDRNPVVGWNLDEATALLRQQWSKLAEQHRTPTVIFATSQVAAQAVARMLRDNGISTQPDGPGAPSGSRVMLVALCYQQACGISAADGLGSDLPTQVFLLPTNYARPLAAVSERLAAGLPVYK